MPSDRFVYANNKTKAEGKGTAKNIIFMVSDGMSSGK
jgi:alkaline phosphatase